MYVTLSRVKNLSFVTEEAFQIVMLISDVSILSPTIQNVHILSHRICVYRYQIWIIIHNNASMLICQSLTGISDMSNIKLSFEPRIARVSDEYSNHLS